MMLPLERQCAAIVVRHTVAFAGAGAGAGAARGARAPARAPRQRISAVVLAKARERTACR